MIQVMLVNEIACNNARTWAELAFITSKQFPIKTKFIIRIRIKCERNLLLFQLHQIKMRNKVNIRSGHRPDDVYLMTFIVDATEKPATTLFSIIAFAHNYYFYQSMFCLIHSSHQKTVEMYQRIAALNINYLYIPKMKSFAKQEIDFHNNQIQFAFICSFFFYCRCCFLGFVCDSVSWCSKSEPYRAKRNGNDLMTKLFECHYCKLKSTRHLTFRSNYFFFVVVAIAIESKFYYECGFRRR